MTQAMTERAKPADTGGGAGPPPRRRRCDPPPLPGAARQAALASAPTAAARWLDRRSSSVMISGAGPLPDLMLSHAVPRLQPEMAAQSQEGHYGRAVRSTGARAAAVLVRHPREHRAEPRGRASPVHPDPRERRRAPRTRRCRHPHLPALPERPRADRGHGARHPLHYFRCPGEHGRFTVATEFLREKSFVRPLAPAELAELRRQVKQIQCSSCGAPGGLSTTGSACGHCRAPVSMLDPDQVKTLMRQLQQAEERRKTEDPALARGCSWIGSRSTGCSAIVPPRRSTLRRRPGRGRHCRDRRPPRRARLD